MTASTCSSNTVTDLASKARRIALVRVVQRQGDGLNLARIGRLLNGSKYGPDLGKLTIGDLLATPKPKRRRTRPMRELMPLIREYVQASTGPIATAEIRERFSIPRWTAQHAMTHLEQHGIVERHGKTGTTFYTRVT